MARTTVREHLLQLKEKGLLTRTEEREGRGRPSHRYEMTRRAKVLFPSRDGELMGRLVRFLKEQGAEALVQTFFEAYWDDRTEAVKRKLRQVASDDIDDKVETLREILEESREIRYRWVADELPQQPEWHEVRAALPATP